MLDENLPTFRFQTAADNPSTSILFLTEHGSDPSPEYIFRRADPTTQPASRNKYAAALCSAYAGADVVYAEVVVEPEWTQPSLSAVEIRNAGGATPAPVPLVPESFTLHLYNPDQGVTFKTLTSTWTKSDSWEFEMPTQSFRMPSSSALDREREDARQSPDGTAVGAGLTVPRIVFRWKRDGRLSKDMTCYLVGKNLGGGKKSKEPDITVALFKAGKESAVTIYEPNLQRVEVEDRKGLEVVLLLGAEVIRDLYLVPRQDVFNVSGGPGAALNGGRRKNSRPSPTPPAAMSGALGNVPPQQATSAYAPPGPSPPHTATADIDAETRRLQAMVAQEEREREKREKAEQKRIKKMLEEEEKERRRREAEVARETERLKKLYGVQGQDLPSSSPPLPPRQNQQGSSGALYPPPQGAGGGWYGSTAPPPHLPPRPLSVGPVSQQGPGPSWWRGHGATGPPPQQEHGGRTWRSGSGGAGAGLGILNPAAASSGFFGGGREDKERKKVQKKRSMHW
ncbi:Protein transport protein SEC31 [Coniochaeta hoffmannii]|uniref:Protein transport protein SEC31 n=1 Tax=Coniochaeta hoffmannii TaxID=91930 RepID=A0AA38S2S5_9PEZI|nr:Protein transport protein SEC31 [Coniochaeta hoffmannii]